MFRSVCCLIPFLIFLGGCVERNISVQKVNKRHEVEIEDGFRATIASSYMPLGSGTCYFQTNVVGSFAQLMVDTSNSLRGKTTVFAKISMDRSVEEAIALSCSNRIGSFFSFKEGQGSKQKIGSFTYVVDVYKSGHVHPAVKDASVVIYDKGYTMSENDYYVLTYTKHFSRSIRRLSYLVDSSVVPDFLKTQDELMQYLKSRFHESLQVK